MLHLLAALSLTATEGTQRALAWETSLQLGANILRFPGSDQQLKNAFYIEPRIGFRVFRPFVIELGLGLSPSGGVQTPVSVFVLNPHLDVDFDIANGGDGVFGVDAPWGRIRFFPYAGAGLGAIVFSAAKNPVANIATNIQGGFRIGLWRDLGVRVEGRGVFYSAANPVFKGPGILGNFVFSVGAYWMFGGKDPDPATPASTPAPCPEPPQAASAPVVAEVLPPPDQDGDGIPDAEDACPVEPGKADKRGCPDKPVVQEERERLVIGERAKFDLNSANIAPEYQRALDAVAGFIGKHKEIALIGVYGHSDNQARPEYNLKISQERAQAVADYIASKGIARERLTSKGFGDTRPIASNNSPRGRAENRRVEFVILKRTD